MRVLGCLVTALLSQAGALRPEVVDLEARKGIPHFDVFLQRYGRAYSEDSAEYALRRSHYEERAEAARSQNDVPGRLWTAGVSHLWDWTHAEISQLHGYRPSQKASAVAAAAFLQLAAAEDEGELSQQRTGNVDRRATKIWKLHALRPVDQGYCGSCWAVSAATVLDAHAEIKGLNRTFSAQHMVNCIPNPHHCGGTGGCDGGTSELAYNYLMTVGLATTEAVPYKGRDAPCESALTMAAPSAFHYEKLPENRYQPVLLALLNDGPVVVAVASSYFSTYERGIFDGCPRDAVVDHGVALVGFGLEGDVGYWQIRNSWTEYWGEHGHIRLLRTDSEEEYCGIDNKPADGMACEDAMPVSVRVCGMCGILYDAVVPHFNSP